jgi:GntR family transcriptional regulator
MEILGQRFADDLLPSESELMLLYRTGRNVVRAALAQLQCDGLIARVQGAGTFVVDRKLRHRTMRDLGIAGSARATELRPTSRVLASSEVAATGRIARKLGLTEGTPCGAFDILLAIDGVPAVLMTSYLPVERIPPGLERFVFATDWDGDWYDALDEVGIVVAGRELAVEAVLADPLVAPLLKVQEGEPLLVFERRLFSPDGRVFEYGFAYCRGDRVAVLFEEHVIRKQGGDR